MSDEKIFMTTKLAGENTRFLPFNKGLENPEIPNDYKTSYLYKDILQINKLSKLIANNSKENVEAIFDKYFDKEMLFLLQNNLNFFKKISDNEKLKKKLRKDLLDLVYEEKKKSS